jgi:hypothetical protein
MSDTGLSMENWRAMSARLDRLEAEHAVRRVMTRYMRLCDQPDNGFPISELGILFTKDAIWEGGGSTYGAAFGQHKGRNAIVAFIESYRQPNPHFAMNTHFLTSENIEANGNAAEGRWIMLQLSTYTDGRSSILGARIRARFAIEDSEWRIAHFQTENLFNAPWRRDGDGRTDFLTPSPAMKR